MEARADGVRLQVSYDTAGCDPHHLRADPEPLE